MSGLVRSVGLSLKGRIPTLRSRVAFFDSIAGCRFSCTAFVYSIRASAFAFSNYAAILLGLLLATACAPLLAHSPRAVRDLCCVMSGSSCRACKRSAAGAGKPRQIQQATSHTRSTQQLGARGTKRAHSSTCMHPSARPRNCSCTRAHADAHASAWPFWHARLRTQRRCPRSHVRNVTDVSAHIAQREDPCTRPQDQKTCVRVGLTKHPASPVHPLRVPRAIEVNLDRIWGGVGGWIWPRSRIAVLSLGSGSGVSGGSRTHRGICLGS